jgi:hypothetical protein
MRPFRASFVSIGKTHDRTGASMNTLSTRQLEIQFLYLDLDSCTRCRATDATLLAAIARTRAALQAADVSVRLTRTLVTTEASALNLGFVSSPTIRINGVDIAGELVESACGTDGDACACKTGCGAAKLHAAVDRRCSRHA